MNYKHSCVIDADKHYKTLVLVLQESDPETGQIRENIQYYKLLEGESLIDTKPPTMRPYAGAEGLVSPRWSEDTATWEEAATAAELAAWEAEHPAPEPTDPPASNLEDRVETLETEKADKSEEQAVWDSMATAYGEGVQEA